MIFVITEFVKLMGVGDVLNNIEISFRLPIMSSSICQRRSNMETLMRIALNPNSTLKVIIAQTLSRWVNARKM